MRVSVVIPTLNRAKFLNHCLHSLARQECKPYELIVVYNGSKDNTKEVVMSYQEFLPIIYVLEKNQDVSVARNAGIKVATGEIIAFTDDDCVVDENWVKNIIEVYKTTDSKIVGGRTLNGYQENLICRLWQRVYVLWFNSVCVLSINKINYYEFPSERCFVKTLLTNNVSYAKEIFNAVEWFKPKASMNEDAEFHYRLRSLGNRILYSPELSVSHYYRKSISSMIRALYVSGKGLFLIKKGKNIYNSILELNFIDKCTFILHLLYYPIYLLRKKEIVDALFILPFFIIKEIAVFVGFSVAQIRAVFENS